MNSNIKLPLVQDDLLNDSAISTASPEDMNALFGNVSAPDLARGILVSYSGMPSFTQIGMPVCSAKDIRIGTSTKPATSRVSQYTYTGKLNTMDGKIPYCPFCGCELIHNGTTTTSLKHLPIGSAHTELSVSRQRWICSNRKCKYNWTELIDFKAKGHFITTGLETFIVDLLNRGELIKDISILTGVHPSTIKAIDKERLQEKYTVDGKVLKKPAVFSEYIGIDEFLLHKGYKYATVIMDLKSGHVLYLAHGKKKQTVYDFIDWIGMDWMKHVRAVACDMNSDYKEAFQEKCEWIDTVYDHFHIIKNFNDKVMSAVRKDEQNRLKAEGNTEAANDLKHTKYILMSTKETRKKKEKDARKGRVISRRGELFNKPERKQQPGIEKEYQELIKENELFFTLDLVKEQLAKAYRTPSERGMKIHINRIIRICRETENKHFIWFADLLENHLDGILTYTKHRISSGKVEGTNNMIKSLRRKGYGYPDDDYFFLKIMDSSRKFSTLS